MERVWAGLCRAAPAQREAAVRQDERDRGDKKDVDQSGKRVPGGHADDPNESEDNAQGEQHGLGRSR